jgi:hypothetical protein
MIIYANAQGGCRIADDGTGNAALPLPQGEVQFDHWPTDAELAAAFPSYVAPPSAAWLAHQAQAQALLDKSDMTIIRCAENGVPVPATWAAYRKALRVISGATTGDPTQVLPTAPAFPAGT